MAIRLAVVIDANVLVQAPVRDTLLRSAEGRELYRPLWSAEIMAEVDRVLDTVTSTVVFVDLSEALTPLIKLAAARRDCVLLGEPGQHGCLLVEPTAEVDRWQE